MPVERPLDPTVLESLGITQDPETLEQERVARLMTYGGGVYDAMRPENTKLTNFNIDGHFVRLPGGMLLRSDLIDFADLMFSNEDAAQREALRLPKKGAYSIKQQLIDDFRIVLEGFAIQALKRQDVYFGVIALVKARETSILDEANIETLREHLQGENLVQAARILTRNIS